MKSTAFNSTGNNRQQKLTATKNRVGRKNRQDGEEEGDGDKSQNLLEGELDDSIESDKKTCRAEEREEDENNKSGRRRSRLRVSLLGRGGLTDGGGLRIPLGGRGKRRRTLLQGNNRRVGEVEEEEEEETAQVMSPISPSR